MNIRLIPCLDHISLDQVVWWKDDVATLGRVSPIFVFAFTCHTNLFCIYLFFLLTQSLLAIHNELVSNTNRRMHTVIFTTSFVTYTL